MKVITKMELQPDMVLGEDILDQESCDLPCRNHHHSADH